LTIERIRGEGRGRGWCAAAVLLLTAVSGSWLLRPAPAAAQEFELPDDLADKPCPPGTRPDGKGFCEPIPEGEQPPAAAAEPEGEPEAAPSPPAASPPKAEPEAAPDSPAAPPPKDDPEGGLEGESKVEAGGDQGQAGAAAAAGAAGTPSPPQESPPGEFEPFPGEPPPSPEASAPEDGPGQPEKEQLEKIQPEKVQPDEAQPQPEAVADEGEEGADGEDGEKGEEGGDGAEEGEEQEFVKGELSALLGTSKLVTKNNRVGVRLGWQEIDLVHYLTINPELDLRFGELRFGLGVPLAIEIFDGHLESEQDFSDGFGDAGDFRTEDWDEWQEYARFLRYLTYGRKEDNIYLNLSQTGSNTLGHGALLRRYSVNIDPDSTRVAGQFDMYNDYAGFELTTNSILSWDLFGVLGFVKPLSFFMDHWMARSLSIGYSYAADRDAPVLLATRPAEGADPARPFYVLGDARPKVASSAWLHTMGVDAELKVVRSDTVDLKPFIDFSWMMPTEPSGPGADLAPKGGNGFTFGLLGRFNFGADPVHALRLVAEFRSFSANYLPGYFDTFYELQKYIMHQHYAKVAQQSCPQPPYGADARCLPPTKFREIFVERKGGDRKLGFYAEFNYSVVDYFSLTLALEGSNARNGNHFLAHLEVPALDWLQFFVTFHQRAMPEIGDLFSTTSADKMLFAAARLRILPFLFINFRYHHTLMLREQTRDINDDGLEDFFRAYTPHHAWMGDIEFGWEF
jgi:hypothetical protein